MVYEDIFDPFSSKRVVPFNNLIIDRDDAWSELKFNTDTEYLQLSKIGNLNLIDLQTESLHLQSSHEEIQDLELEDVDEGITTSSSSTDPPSQASTEAEVDIWTLKETVSQTEPTLLLGWDQFNHPKEVDHDQKFITESTAREFDRFQLELYRSEHKQPLRIANNDAFQQALANLVLGRSSAFFVWNGEASKFDLVVQDFAITGCSRLASVRLCEYFSAFGSRYRRLRDYSQSTKQSHPTEYAFQRSLERLLLALESCSSITRREQARCMWALKEVEKMTELLSALEHLKIVSVSSRSEMDFLTLFVAEIDKIWLASYRLRPVLAALVSDTTRPATQQTHELIGMHSRTRLTHENEVWLFTSLFPDLEKVVVDVKISLSSMNGLDSSLLQGQSHRKALVHLAHSWANVVQLHDSADDIEKSSRVSQVDVRFPAGLQLLSETGQGLAACPDPFSLDFDLVAPIGLSLAVDAEEHQPLDISVSREAVHLMSGTAVDSISELSPMQAIGLSLRPFIELQNRLTSFAVMKALFVQHNLKAHLDVLNAFFVFGSGAFATRLVTALFDSGQDNIERRRKSGLTGGLRLEDREAWPPASSELRLALNGILTETIQNKISSSILDCVSFSIKDLSDEEAELCRNTQSIHALDFLRITYVPSDVMLESIITTKVLEKYDRIFNFMLILLRVHSLCQGLLMRTVKSGSRSCSALYNKFCMEANHFVTMFLDYAMHNAIYVPWRAFAGRISDIYQYIKVDDYQRTMDAAKSVSQLCQDHDDTLDNILKGLILKKKHRKTFDLLCDMLNLILKFSSDLKNASKSTRIRGVFETFQQLRLKWYRAAQEVCNSTDDPALQRLQVLLLQIDLSGTLGLSERVPATQSGLT